MSVGEDQTECPLCMEPLEMDDINFFPCTCGYQICRFCWHRIRTDENGLCPACRKAYPEDPAEFKPLTEDELQRIKKERRQKEAQRKQKAAENRKHLANVRVVQKNLVFVVGLSQRLADPEVLKKHEYFGKFGKIHKVVINQSTSYAGAQVGGPSASAYVTYHKPEDALKAIQAVNNIHVDGRTLKASLGTTKYCSHFLRGAQCPKPDCMYLHELGEETASFTKEEMQQGKHQEYEQRLYEQYMNSQNLATNQNATTEKVQTRKKTSSPVQNQESSSQSPPPQTTKEAWPSLQVPPSSSPTTTPALSKPDRLTNGNKAPPQPTLSNSSGALHSQSLSNPDLQNAQNRAPGFHRSNGQHTDSMNSKTKAPSPEMSPNGSSSESGGSNSPSNIVQSQFINRSSTEPGLPLSPHHTHPTQITHKYPASSSPNTQTPFAALRSGMTPQPPPGLVSAAMAAAGRKLPFQSASDSMSLFSSSNGFPSSRNPKPPQQQLQSPDDALPVAAEIPDSIPVSTSTDWQAAFGFTSTTSTDLHDDDLGFDPWNESAKALAEIIENENTGSPNCFKTHFNPIPHPHSPHSPSSPRQPGAMHGSLHHHPGAMPNLMSNMTHISQLLDNGPKSMPPGFSQNHAGALANNQMGPPPGSKIMNLMQFPSVPQTMSNPSNYHDMMNSDLGFGKRDNMPSPQNDEPVNTKDWQDGLRALLPNINISFGQGEENRLLQRSPQYQHMQQQQQLQQQQQQQHFQQQLQNSHKNNHEEPPHWMASLHHLTEDTAASTVGSSHRLPPQMPFRNTGAVWPPQTLAGAPHPPPGFHNPQMRPQGAPEVQQLADGFQ